MRKLLNANSIRRILIFLGIGFFLLAVTLCAHFANPTDYATDTSVATCDLSEVISSISVSKESMGLLFLLMLLALASLALPTISSYPKTEVCLQSLYSQTYSITNESWYKVLDPFLLALRKGIIHPKLYNTAIIS